MIIFMSITIGLIITIFSFIMIRKEVMKASFFKHVKLSDSISDDVIHRLQDIEHALEEMNQSYYDIVSDLEGKYSVHEKEIELLDHKLNDVHEMSKDLSRMLNYQGKEIASIREPEPIEVPKRAVQSKETLKDEIARLVALGYDENQIAKKLNKGIREIRMIMNVIRNK